MVTTTTAGQQTDDHDHHEQLDQRKATFTHATVPWRRPGPGRGSAIRPCPAFAGELGVEEAIPSLTGPVSRS